MTWREIDAENPRQNRSGPRKIQYAAPMPSEGRERLRKPIEQLVIYN
jgi:hypothetical protein